MYIQTEDNKILNLSHYRSVDVYEMTDAYVLRAFLSIGFEDKSKYDDIASFDEKVDADYALSNLFKAILNSRTPWNVNTVKSLSEAWCKVKKDNSSMEYLDKLELIGISGLGEVTIAYPAIYKGVKGFGDTARVVIDKLREVLSDNKIQFKWEACADLDR